MNRKEKWSFRALDSETDTVLLCVSCTGEGGRPKFEAFDSAQEEMLLLFGSRVRFRRTSARTAHLFLEKRSVGQLVSLFCHCGVLWLDL